MQTKEIKQLRILRNHLVKYYPTITAIKEVYGFSLQVREINGTNNDIMQEPFYVCPLCAQQFCMLINSAIVGAEFNLDHYPPASVGGKATILVCKDCNSNFGKDVDYALAEVFRHKAFLTGSSSTPAKVSMDIIKGKYNVEMVKKSEDQFTLIDRSRNSYIKSQFHEISAKSDIGKIPINFEVKISLPSEVQVRKAILKAAYLYCFANLGYEFVFSEAGTHIRGILNGKISSPLKNLGVFYDLLEGQLDDGFYAAYYPAINEFVFIIAINIAPKHLQKKTCSFVIIPPFTQGACDRLVSFERLEHEKEGSFNIKNLSGDLIQQKWPLPYSELTKLF
jgi:hypothetical protein